MYCFNQCNFIGNIVKDAQYGKTKSGIAWLRTTVAINKKWTQQSSGELKEKVLFLPIILWGKKAENMNDWLKKGRRVHLSGELEQRSWIDDNSIKRTVFELNVQEIIMLDSKPKTEEKNHTGLGPNRDDDIPF